MISQKGIQPASGPVVSVIICTYNPRRDYFSEVLARLKQQETLFEWDLTVVDNNSSPAITRDDLASMGWSEATLIHESRQGLTYARCAGIQSAQAPLICFVDDDNYLEPDYIESVVRIAEDNPEMGAYGGKGIARFESEPDNLVKHYLPFLGVRDLGDQPIVGSGAEWGPWEPIGAGLVVRRDVAKAFLDFVEKTDGAFGLGRSGNSLLSGEDSLFSRIADRMGYRVGYFPELILHHVMPTNRLNRDYIFRLMEGHGRTHVILELIAGRQPEKSDKPLWLTLTKRFLHRVRSPGLIEARGHLHWDRGFFEERHSDLAERAALMGPDALHAVTVQASSKNRRLKKFSIIIPVFNGASTIKQALESLKAQNDDDLEVIVIDGGSTDGTADIARQFGAPVTTVLSEPDNGQADAINKGFSQASGDYFGWLCADDLLTENALKTAREIFEKFPAADVITGGCRRCFPDGSTLVTRPAEDFEGALYLMNPIEQPSTFWKRLTWEKVGKLNTEMHYAFDWEYWCRMKTAGLNFIATDEILSVYTFSDTNKTSSGGRAIVHEMQGIIRAYGPYWGLLSWVYRLLYQIYDLNGFYDTPGATHKPVWQQRMFHLTLKFLYTIFDRESINRYNWNWVSRQERNNLKDR